MAAISALLTLPFLFAAAIQALLRSDLEPPARRPSAISRSAMLGGQHCRAADDAAARRFGRDLGDRLLGVGRATAGFFPRHVAAAAGLSALSGSSFLAFVVGLLTVAATITLWIELLIRSAAVYVIVLMLPLFFAALVWPARRVWAVRAVELLVALILSKFVIVAVLALGGAALVTRSFPSLTETLAGDHAGHAGGVLALGAAAAAPAARAGRGRRRGCAARARAGAESGRRRRGRASARTSPSRTSPRLRGRGQAAAEPAPPDPRSAG